MCVCVCVCGCVYVCVLSWKEISFLLKLQLTPTLTDFKGPTILICYRQISAIANVEIKDKLFKGLKNIFSYRQISITGTSISAGFNCSISGRLL